jgi:hypothetical protein
MAKNQTTVQGTTNPAPAGVSSELTTRLKDVLGLIEEEKFYDPEAWNYKPADYAVLLAAGLIESTNAYRVTDTGSAIVTELDEISRRQLIRKYVRKLQAMRPGQDMPHLKAVMRTLPKERLPFLDALFDLLNTITGDRLTESARRKWIAHRMQYLKLNEADTARFKLIVADMIDLEAAPAPEPAEPEEWAAWDIPVTPYVERLNRIGMVSWQGKRLLEVVIGIIESKAS